MTGFIELIRRSKSSRTRTNNCHFLTGSGRRWIRLYPSFLKSFVNDGAFNAFDCHGRLNNTQYARALTRCRTNSSSEFWEVVGLVQAVQSIFPFALIYQVIPLRNKVIDWTTAGHITQGHTRVAIRSATIHTAGTLLTNLIGIKWFVNFLPVLNPFQWFAVRNCFPLVL